MQTSGFSLGLVMRRLLGVGTPRGFQGRVAALLLRILGLWRVITSAGRDAVTRSNGRDRPRPISTTSLWLLNCRLETGTCTTGC
jgi:hypothetical protein